MEEEEEAEEEEAAARVAVMEEEEAEAGEVEVGCSVEGLAKRDRERAIALLLWHQRWSPLCA